MGNCESVRREPILQSMCEFVNMSGENQSMLVIVNLSGENHLTVHSIWVIMNPVEVNQLAVHQVNCESAESKPTYS